MSTLLQLSAETVRAFCIEPVVGGHALSDSPLFADEALIALLDRMPREYVYAFTVRAPTSLR
jgi:hypothetical protein